MLKDKQLFIGNNVFKYSFNELNNGKSSIWEFLFYDELSIVVYLIFLKEKNKFLKTKAEHDIIIK